MRDCSAVCARNASSRVYTVAHVSRVGRLRNQACSQLRCVHTDNASVITYMALSDVYRGSLNFFFFFFFPYFYYSIIFNECLPPFFIFRWKKISRYMYTLDRSNLCKIHKVWFELINVSLMITILQYEIKIIIRKFYFFKNRILRSGRR